MSRLAELQALTNAKPDAVKPSRLATKLGASPRGQTMELPLLGSCYVALLGQLAEQEIEAEVFRYMTELGLELSTVTALSYESERAIRTLARVVFVDAAKAEAVGSLADWRGMVDGDLLNVLWLRYQDLREELSPMPSVLTADTRKEILAAVQKKKRSAVATVRCRESSRLFAYYGRPAADLTDTEVEYWGLVAGVLTFPEHQAVPHNVKRRIINLNYREPD